MPRLIHLRIHPTRPLRERVHSRLRRAILAGEIPTGERLVESQLASEIGTSRTPIREALHKLELENLIESLPRVGYFVKGFSDEDIRDICEIRMAIESLAAQRAIVRITQRDLELLKRNIEQSRETVERGSTKGMMDLDTEFHERIYAQAEEGMPAGSRYCSPGSRWARKDL